jgi:hypothetical protein
LFSGHEWPSQLHQTCLIHTLKFPYKSHASTPFRLRHGLPTNMG